MAKKAGYDKRTEEALAAFRKHRELEDALRREIAAYRDKLSQALAKGDEKALQKILENKKLRKVLARQRAPVPPSVSFFPLVPPFPPPDPIPRQDPDDCRHKFDIEEIYRRRELQSFDFVCNFKETLTIEDADYFEDPPQGSASARPLGGKSLDESALSTTSEDQGWLCLESGGNWFWRLSERVEFCGGQAARSRVSSAIS